MSSPEDSYDDEVELDDVDNDDELEEDEDVEDEEEEDSLEPGGEEDYELLQSQDGMPTPHAPCREYIYLFFQERNKNKNK